MNERRYQRVTDTRKRYMDNIYKTRRSQSDRRRIRIALKSGGADLTKAMDDILARPYDRNTYMGLNIGG